MQVQAVPFQHASSVKFAAVKEELKPELRSWLTQQVLIDEINQNAFWFTDSIRRLEGVTEESGKRRRRPLHDEAALALVNMKPPYNAAFRGIAVFVTELRQLLSVAGIIPSWLKFIPVKGKPYRPDTAHQTMSPTEAQDRLDTLRAVIVELSHERDAATP